MPEPILLLNKNSNLPLTSLHLFKPILLEPKPSVGVIASLGIVWCRTAPFVKMPSLQNQANKLTWVQNGSQNQRLRHGFRSQPLQGLPIFYWTRGCEFISQHEPRNLYWWMITWYIDLKCWVSIFREWRTLIIDTIVVAGNDVVVDIGN